MSGPALTALEDWEGVHEPPETQPLADSDVVRLTRVLWHTPSSAVPGSVQSWGRADRPVTGRDVARAFAMLADAHSAALVDRDNAREELRTLKADVATMRRVLFGSAS